MKDLGVSCLIFQNYWKDNDDVDDDYDDDDDDDNGDDNYDDDYGSQGLVGVHGSAHWLLLWCKSKPTQPSFTNDDVDDDDDDDNDDGTGDDDDDDDDDVIRTSQSSYTKM